MNYDLYLFDLDGTLTDSEQGIFNSWIYACNKLGIETPDLNTLRSFIGPPLHDTLRKLKGKIDVSDEDVQKAVDVYR